MIRDAEATRTRLLASARKEFAAYGIAGARVDRIAADAQSNKAQIYHYFGSKDGLFDALFDSIVSQVVEGIPIDAHDLPGYARRLTLGNEEHPDVDRLATWRRLERGDGDPVPAGVEINRAKIAEVARAQADGIISSRYPPDLLLAMVVQLAATWAQMHGEYAAAADLPSAEQRAALVESAVRDLISD